MSPEIQVGDIIRFEDADYYGVGRVMAIIDYPSVGRTYEVNLGDGDDDSYPVYPGEVHEVWRIGVLEKED